MRYGKCECGGRIAERRIRYARRFRGKLFEFENVPVGVCLECGERIFKGVVLEQIEELSNQNKRFERKTLVPVGVYK